MSLNERKLLFGFALENYFVFFGLKNATRSLSALFFVLASLCWVVCLALGCLGRWFAFI